ncbi:MAG: hypothetical protein OXG39_06175 [Chloroflexi bacterium]|nr:hypothetical protein [Chloroflexota bacterium]
MRHRRAVVTGFSRTWALATGLLLALILLSPAHRVVAADIMVDENCLLPDAIQAAESDAAVRGCAAGSGADTIHLSGDIALAAELPQITSDITIEGGGYSISGDKLFRIFYVSDGSLSINRLNLTAGFAAGGGAIYNAGKLEITDGSFDGNLAKGGEVGAGGGAISNHGELNITRTHFSSNSAASDGLPGGFGGAIYNDGLLNISKSNFIDNSAANAGGAIRTDDGAITITDSTFTGNSAGSSGGAIYDDSIDPLTIENSSFDRNLADYGGGAIQKSSNGSLVVTGSSFLHNRNDGWGSAINNSGRLVVSNCSFIKNSAGDSATINNSYKAEITDSTFDSNTAETASVVFNGGSYLAEMAISNSVFTNNAAQEFSGAIVNGKGGKLIVNGSRFVGNSASSGGVISNIGDELIISGSSFSNNSALGMSGDVGEHLFERSLAKGAGGAILNLGPLSIAESNFVDNSAGFGGAIFSLADLSIVNSTIAGNSAENGGGLYIYFLFPSSVTMTQLTIVDNSASEGGGIVVVFEEYEETAAYLYNSLIAGNPGGDCLAETLSASSGNLIEDGSCDAAISGDPKLGTLVEPEDGSPPYYPLLPDSPAIDAADPDHCSASDQTGIARPQGAACDIGAYEFRGD